MCTHVRVYVYVCMYVCKCRYICLYMYVFVCICVCVIGAEAARSLKTKPRKSPLGRLSPPLLVKAVT